MDIHTILHCTTAQNDDSQARIMFECVPLSKLLQQNNDYPFQVTLHFTKYLLKTE